MPLPFPSSGQPPLISIFSCQHPFERLAALRRHASTKATPLAYKQTAPSSKKSHTAPPTGFAAIGSYNTISRRYEPTDHGSSFIHGFQVDCYYCWYSLGGGDKLRTVPETYGPSASVHLTFANKATVVLGKEQKPLTSPPEGPLTAKRG